MDQPKNMSTTESRWLWNIFFESHALVVDKSASPAVILDQVEYLSKGKIGEEELEPTGPEYIGNEGFSCYCVAVNISAGIHCTGLFLGCSA